MASFLNVVRFNPTAGGTTDWTFSTAVTGYQSPASAGVVNGTLYKYRAESADLTQWELGQGAYNTGTGVLPRTTVLYNSAGTGTGAGQSGAGTKINFTLTPQVAVVALTEDLPGLTLNNSFSGIQTITNATASTTTGTGAVVVTGGVGAGGAGNFGGNVSGPLFKPTNTATSHLAHVDTSGNGILTVAASSNSKVVTGAYYGLLVLSETQTLGISAMYLMSNHTTSLVGGTGLGTFVASTTTPGSSTLSVAFDGTDFSIYNGFAASKGFEYMFLRTS